MPRLVHTPLFYFTLYVKSLYNRLQSLLRKLPTEKKAVSHTQFLRFGKNYLKIFTMMQRVNHVNIIKMC